MQEKKTEPCVICGFDIYTEKHHPKGRADMIVIYKDGDEVMVMPYESNIHSTLMRYKGKDTFIKEEKRYVCPDETIPLCFNCHYLFHKRRMSYVEIKESYLSTKLIDRMLEATRHQLPSKLVMLSEVDDREKL
jgi:hypothetical protein